MAIERTFSIIKPDAVARDKIGEVVSLLEAGGLRVVAQRMLRLTRAQAEAFYAVHRERPFYSALCDFMTEGPVVVQVLEGEGAIAKNREIMGATDSRKAAPGTIRNRLGTDVQRNACHGSDAPETARAEIAFFFSTADLVTTSR
jgi:nucleoside-diphosphate kinase